MGRRSSVAASGPRLNARDPDQDVVGRRLRVFDEDVEVAVIVEDAGVEQLVLGVRARAPLVLGHEIRVRKRPLRILVQVFHVRVAGKVVEVEVVFLDVLAVIALVAGQPEHPLLEERIGAVPQREREAQVLRVVGNAGNAVLAPAVRARSRVLVRKIFPGRSIGAVVLAHGAPLALADVRSESAPRRLAGARGLEPLLLVGQRRHVSGHRGLRRVCPRLARSRVPRAASRRCALHRRLR